MNEEDGAGGAEGMPDISGVDGFVGNDDEEEEQDARAQDAQPTEVNIPSTYLWGVVSAQLQECSPTCRSYAAGSSKGSGMRVTCQRRKA